MRFGAVPVAQALGGYLAHSIDLPDARLRKGQLLDRAQVDMLRQAGWDMVSVAQLDHGDIHEDAGAARLAAALVTMGCGLRASGAATGRVNLYVTARGVVRVAADAVHAINRIDPALTLATVAPMTHVQAGAMVATIKIIPYALPLIHIEQAETHAPGALSLAATQARSATLIETVAGRDLGPKGALAVAGRLDDLGVTLAQSLRVGHSVDALADGLAQATGDIVLILTASATSDIDDVAPTAVRQAGGAVHHYGMPVDPGNLLFLGELGPRPVIGLPGCARSVALNGADWVLERVACGVTVSPGDIMAMGVGGLLKEIPTRPRPREGGDHAKSP